MSLRHYETVFILTPVLSDSETKDAVEKFKNFIVENGGEISNEENWGLKKLAYPIQKKKTGVYALFQFAGSSEIVAKLETEYKRDENILRFLTTVLDKHALAYSEKRKQGKFNKKEQKEEVAS